MIIADVIWPAIYICSTRFNFWFSVIITILVEAVFLKIFLRITVLKSLTISAAGNVISGIFGTIFFTIFLALFEGIIDLIINGFSFSPASWILSYIVLCAGSILIEMSAIKIIWKYDFKNLWKPVSIGNVLSYLIIIYLNNFNIFYKGIQ
ncbi:MAG: hypothetical protein ACHQJ4_08010 [Ignavibacteria bacterium]